MKTIKISSKPTAKPDDRSTDLWVTARNGTFEATDVPLSLHQRVKSQCALSGKKMADVVRELLEKHFSG